MHGLLSFRPQGDVHVTFHVIYKITHLPTGRFYIGAHSTDDLDDGYMGSGIHIERAIKKYGKESFSKEILFHAFTVDDLYLMEKELVILSPQSFNIVPGGIGGDKVSFLSEEQKEQHAKKSGIASKTFWNNITETELLKRQVRAIENLKSVDRKSPQYRQARAKFGKDNHFTGKKHSPEAKEKMRLKKLGNKNRLAHHG